MAKGRSVPNGDASTGNTNWFEIANEGMATTKKIHGRTRIAWLLLQSRDNPMYQNIFRFFDWRLRRRNPSATGNARKEIYRSGQRRRLRFRVMTLTLLGSVMFGVAINPNYAYSSTPTAQRS